MNALELKSLGAVIEQFSEQEDGIHATAISGVNWIRLSERNAPLPSVYSPCLCVIVQGGKRVFLGKEIFEYRPSQYLAVSVDLPVVAEITEGNSERPYLCLQIELDQLQIAEVLVQARLPMERGNSARRGIIVGEMDGALGDSVIRLAKLLETPQDIPVLAPLIKREIYYRLLCGPYGETIAQFARVGSQTQRIAVAIQHLKANYHKPFRVEELAGQVGMSVSSFHAHFKVVTAMSPLQYQKCLRLMEARQIMLAEMRDAVSTAYRVGYESPSQFSREYARLFGQPPGRDIQRLTQAKAGA